MQTLTLDLGPRSYPIYIGPGLITRAELWLAHLAQRKVAIVTNTTVATHYLGAMRGALEGAGIEVAEIVVPDGEAHKDWRTLNLVFDGLLASRCERNTTVVALGGGVIGDLAGFAAATYQRGVPLLQVPTTLLAQVDSSVGGKTAINHPLGKNMVGAFYQPRAVIADTATLATLPPRELSCGAAEIIKYGVIRDRAFFDWLERNVEKLIARDTEALAYAIRRSCENKAAVVAQDEKESGVRALLNFGHTFGHAIEAGLGYGRWLHGEAVAAGMVLAAELSRRMGLISAGDVERLAAVLKRAGLPVRAPALSARRYLELMGGDKKVEAGKIRFILLRALGEAFVSADVAPAALAQTLESISSHD